MITHEKRCRFFWAYIFPLPLGIAMLSSSSSTSEVAVDVGHEFLHVLRAVVASHVVVKVLRDPLDPIVVRAIGREEVELHLPLPGGHRQLNLAAVMDFVVVEDDVDPTSVSITEGYQPMNQEEEQRAVFAFSFDPSELARAGIQRPGQITLLVLTRCQNLLLLTLEHPVRSDLGVQMNVHLVLVHGDLIRAQVSDSADESMPVAACGGTSAMGNPRSVWGDQAAREAASGADS